MMQSLVVDIVGSFDSRMDRSKCSKCFAGIDSGMGLSVILLWIEVYLRGLLGKSKGEIPSPLSFIVEAEVSCILTRTK